MAKIILKWRYFSNGVQNRKYLKYIATREGVEKLDDKWREENVSFRQKSLINNLKNDEQEKLKSLKIKKGVTRSRNVLTRVERIEKMQATDRWTDETSPFNLPKIRVYKVVLKKKKKVKDADDAPAKGKK